MGLARFLFQVQQESFFFHPSIVAPDGSGRYNSVTGDKDCKVVGSQCPSYSPCQMPVSKVPGTFTIGHCMPKRDLDRLVKYPVPESMRIFWSRMSGPYKTTLIKIQPPWKNPLFACEISDQWGDDPVNYSGQGVVFEGFP